MKNTYVDNWQDIKDHFEQWWKREDVSASEGKKRPLMRIVSRGKPGKTAWREESREQEGRDPGDRYLNVESILSGYRNYCETHYFFADAFPAVDLNLGPGSMALYLGGEPEFTRETVWYKEKLSSAKGFRDLHYDEDNVWWTLHQKMLKEAVELAGGDFFVTVPDIIENADILSALRGPQNLCFDIADEPEEVRRGIGAVDGLYFRYYDRLYETVRDEDGFCSYTSFGIMGKGKTAKIQCDFCALISPDLFRDLIQPSLAKQCRNLDRSIYHLDGPDAIKHVPALMEIKELDALQWTCGAGKPDGGSEDWYPIYDQVKDAEKSLWISFEYGEASRWAEGAKRLVKRYGTKGLYLLFPEFPDPAQAKKMAALFD
jgi:5-methyltetrahydrofolate--homocysteine methyltransferase